MKLIIDIPDIKYQNIVNAYSDINEIYAAIKNGTPIPDNATVCDRMKAERMTHADFKRYCTENNYVPLTTEMYSQAIKAMDALDKIRAEIEAIEINGQVDDHTMFIRSGEQVKSMALDIVDKYKGK